jgi:hypothetical protein
MERVERFESEAICMSRSNFGIFDFRKLDLTDA